MSTGTQVVCGYCGRPIVGASVWGANGPYHEECTRGPGYVPQYYQPTPDFGHEARIAALEARVAALECRGDPANT